ncbi:MAG: hypothetical protein V4734_11720, partial [Terriglobus sp.]
MAQNVPNLPPEVTTSTPERKVPEPSSRDKNAAETSFLAGAKELRDGHFPEAEQQFAKALKLNPFKPEYVQALLLAREHHVSDLLHEAALERPKDPSAADALVAQARKLDPSNPAVEQHAPPVAFKPIRTERLADSIVLLHNSSRHSYHLRADTKTFAETMARDYGLQAVMDPDLQGRNLRIDVDDATFDEAMRVLGLVFDTMYVPLDEHTILVAEDKAENRTRYERLVEQAYFFPGYAADQLKDFVSIAQTILNIQKVSVDPAQNAIVVRGPADLADA